MKIRVRIETGGYHTVLDVDQEVKDDSVQEALVENALRVLLLAASGKEVDINV